MIKNKITPEILKRAKKIRLLAMDIDGVLTAGEVIVLRSGEEIKIWSVKDRMGFYMLRRSTLPIKLAWITARKSTQVKARGEELKVDFLVQKCPDKWAALLGCAKAMKITPDQIAYIGDDLVDLRCLRNVGFAVCPPESPGELKSACHYQTRASAGKGVVREAIEILIKAQGAWKKVLSFYE